MNGTQEITRIVEWIIVGLLVAAGLFVAVVAMGCGTEPRQDPAPLRNALCHPVSTPNLNRCAMLSDAQQAVSELRDSARIASSAADRLRTLADRVRILRPDLKREADDLETQARVLNERVLAGTSQAASAAARICALTLEDGP